MSDTREDKQPLGAQDLPCITFGLGFLLAFFIGLGVGAWLT